MTNVTVSLPDSLKDFLDAEVARGGYSTPSDYLRVLIQQEQERQAHLEQLVREGLQSEVSEMTPEDWESIRDDVHQRHAEHHAK